MIDAETERRAREVEEAGLVMMIAPGALGQITELGRLVESERSPVILCNLNYSHFNICRRCWYWNNQSRLPLGFRIFLWIR